MRCLLFLLAFGVLLSSCDGPAARFDQFTVARPINLSQELGPTVTLLNSEDTLQLRLQFAPTTGTTLITNAQDSAVFLEARIFYQRGLYYAVEDQQSGCWVHALRIRKGQIQGLATGFKQMEDLSALVQHGSFSELVRYRSFSDDSIRLRFSAQPLRRFYLAELDSFPSYRIVTSQPRVAAVPPAAKASISVYPNPATSHATLTFGTSATRSVQVYSAQGQLVHTVLTQGLRQEVVVQNWPAGNYIVRVSTPAATTQTARLLVQH